MYSITVFATALLASTVLAQPKHMNAHRAQHHKRDVQYITKTDYFTEVVVDYTTLYLTAGEQAPSTAAAATTPSGQVQEPSAYVPAASNPVVAPPQEKAALYQPQDTTLATTTTTTTITTTTTPPPAPAAPSVQTTTTVQPVVASSAAAPSASVASSSGQGSLLSYGFNAPSGAGGSKVTECTSESCTGWATFYDVSNTMSCGFSPVDPDQHVVALPVSWMHAPGNSGTNSPIDPNCGRVVEITCSATGQTLQAIVVDSCEACIVGTGHIDLSRGAYAALGVSESVGTPPISWKFVS